jgi:hypothetical protein
VSPPQAPALAPVRSEYLVEHEEPEIVDKDSKAGVGKSLSSRRGGIGQFYDLPRN